MAYAVPAATTSVAPLPAQRTPPPPGVPQPSPAGQFPPGGASPPGDIRRRRRSPWLRWLTLTALITVPLCSLGMLSWAVIAYYAGRRRSIRLGVASAGYLVMEIAGLAMLRPEPTNETIADDLAFGCLLVAAAGGAVHAVILHVTGSATAAADPAHEAVVAITRRVRREQARGIAYHHPAIARELGIGRPDIPGTFDDGGLVDLNAAPEHVLATVPGLDLRLARSISADRTLRGAYDSVDDLVSRAVLPGPLTEELRDTLLVIRRAPATGWQVGHQ
jgi:DNA uptake protein ComE-like DNA-binding protein